MTNYLNIAYKEEERVYLFSSGFHFLRLLTHGISFLGDVVFSNPLTLFSTIQLFDFVRL